MVYTPHSAFRTPHWGHAAFRPSQAAVKGQALVELAVVGSMILLMIGTLVSYGLSATYTQQAKMAAFRRALAESVSLPDPNDPDCRSKGPTDVECKKLGASTLSLLNDRHVINPTDPFAIGSMLPFTASANVVRNYEMHVAPNPADPTGELFLPRQDIVLQGVGFDCPSQGQGCKTSGFRQEVGVSEESRERYDEVFGKGSVCWLPKCGASRVCAEFDTQMNPETGELVTFCVRYTVNVIVLDSCEGEIIDYEGCVKRARMIVDQEACAQSCRASQPLEGAAVDCAGICQQPMQSEQVAWYLQGRYQEAGGRWVFPELEALFAGVKRLGLQPGYMRRNTVDNRLVKTEDQTQISTTTTRTWQQEATRKVLHRTLGGGSARAEPDAVRMPKDETSSTTWTTAW